MGHVIYDRVANTVIVLSKRLTYPPFWCFFNNKWIRHTLSLGKRDMFAQRNQIELREYAKTHSKPRHKKKKNTNKEGTQNFFFFFWQILSF